MSKEAAANTDDTPAVVTGYKGFDKDLRCRGMQFAVGETYAERSAKLCDKGFHFCTGALDCLSYYPAGAGSRYCRVVASGKIDGPGNDGDTKMAATVITIGPELTLTEMVREVVASYLAEAKTTETATTGDGANAATTGYGANAEASGKHSIAAALGTKAKARGALGCWIVIAERDDSYTEKRSEIKCVRAVLVDGETVKADTWYAVRGGELVEVVQ